LVRRVRILKGAGWGWLLTSEWGGVGIHGRDGREGGGRSRSGRCSSGGRENGGGAEERAVLVEMGWEWGMWGVVRGGGSCRWGMISSKYFELASVGTWERAGGGFAGPEIR
jgi:hypothetical protein